MANFVKMTIPNNYIGLSTDTKLTGVEIGSKSYEYDTKKWFITYDGTNWSEMQDLDALVLGAGTSLVGKVGIDQATANANEVVVKSISAGTNALGKVGHDITGIGHGVTTVTTAGTDLVLAASTVAKLVIIQAQTDNTGLIAVGATGVDATIATGTGVALYAGESVTLPVDNLTDIYIDSTVSGEGVRYTYFT